MANTNGVFDALARKGSVSTTQPPRYTALRTIAENLSRKNIDQATCELLSEAHSRLIVLCYERDDSGQLCNVDQVTGRILVPLPFGKAGHRKWALSPSEADALRAIMFMRQRNGLPLFFFDRSRRSWYIDIATYPAMPVLSEWEITVTQYRAARGG